MIRPSEDTPKQHQPRRGSIPPPPSVLTQTLLITPQPTSGVGHSLSEHRGGPRPCGPRQDPPDEETGPGFYPRTRSTPAKSPEMIGGAAGVGPASQPPLRTQQKPASRQFPFTDRRRSPTWIPARDHPERAGIAQLLATSCVGARACGVRRSRLSLGRPGLAAAPRRCGCSGRTRRPRHPRPRAEGRSRPSWSGGAGAGEEQGGQHRTETGRRRSARRVGLRLVQASRAPAMEQTVGAFPAGRGVRPGPGSLREAQARGEEAQRPCLLEGRPQNGRPEGGAPARGPWRPLAWDGVDRPLTEGEPES